LSEAIAKRMRRVRRYEVDSIINSSSVKEGDGGGTRRGSLADTTLADKKEDLLLKELRRMGLAVSRGYFPGHSAASRNSGRSLLGTSRTDSEAADASFTTYRMADRRPFLWLWKNCRRCESGRAFQAAAPLWLSGGQTAPARGRDIHLLRSRPARGASAARGAALL